MNAIDTFRATMRRLERRSCAMGLDLTANQLRLVRLRKPWAPDEARMRRGVVSFRSMGHRANRRQAFLYERAADALARLTTRLERDRADTAAVLASMTRVAASFREVGKAAKDGAVEMRAIAEQLCRLEAAS